MSQYQKALKLLDTHLLSPIYFASRYNKQRACSQSIKNRVHAITILPLAKGWFSHRDIVCRGAEISKR